MPRAYFIQCVYKPGSKFNYSVNISNKPEIIFHNIKDIFKNRVAEEDLLFVATEANLYVVEDLTTALTFSEPSEKAMYFLYASPDDADKWHDHCIPYLSEKIVGSVDGPCQPFQYEDLVDAYAKAFPKQPRSSC
ncbi:hypothetical protein GGI06_005672 [Coemansia sp. S85]|nr:hypothetical protein GGI06_005672 [Coemansia sp. S85]